LSFIFSKRGRGPSHFIGFSPPHTPSTDIIIIKSSPTSIHHTAEARFDTEREREEEEEAVPLLSIACVSKREKETIYKQYMNEDLDRVAHFS
jgi:hypothetical protein